MPVEASDRPKVDVSGTATPGGSCPACEEPLFPWLEISGRMLDRCENCGLVLDRDRPGGDPALVEGVVEIPNAASAQATIGADSWTALPPDGSALLTPRALELLCERRGLELVEISYPARPGMASMLATILNLLTFNRDFPRRALRRELLPGNARAGWIGFAIDGVVTVFTAIPVAILTVVLEGGAVLARRGGAMRATLRRRASYPG